MTQFQSLENDHIKLEKKELNSGHVGSRDVFNFLESFCVTAATATNDVT